MSEQNPTQQLAGEIDSLKRGLDELREKVRLEEARREVERLDGAVTDLRRSLLDLRERGYKFEPELDGRVDDLARRWSEGRPHVLRDLERVAISLEREFLPIEADVARLAAGGPRAFNAARQLQQTKANADSLGQRAESEARSLRAAYEPLENEAEQLSAHIKEIGWSFEQLAEASFKLQDGEGLVRAVKATLVRGEKETKEDPKGILFLSDKRLLFEQKQDVATKKVLFITTQKQRVQSLYFEAPLAQVRQVRGMKAGLLGHEDHIEADLAQGTAHFHLDGQDCALWQRLLSDH